MYAVLATYYLPHFVDKETEAQKLHEKVAVEDWNAATLDKNTLVPGHPRVVAKKRAASGVGDFFVFAPSRKKRKHETTPPSSHCGIPQGAGALRLRANYDSRHAVGGAGLHFPGGRGRGGRRRATALLPPLPRARAER